MPIIEIMKKSILYCLFLLVSLWLFSCEKADEYSSAPRENFEALWKIMDEHYCFFEYKDVDWNDVYARYSVQVTDTMKQDQLFKLLGEMLNELKDGHTNLISSFDVSRYWKWYEDYPANFSEDIQENYLGTDYMIAGGMKYKKLSKDVGYIYYGSFSNAIGETNLDYILMYFKDCKAIILDVRDNGGGSLTYSDRIAARFLDNKITTGYILHKTGTGHNDFSRPYELTLIPSERVRWLRPVVVLTNRHCFSATNDFVNKMKMMPHTTILGDRTGGGSGFPFSSELPNGWSVRFSASPMLNAAMEHTEFGIDPDVKVNMLTEDMQRGKDTLIEAALQLIERMNIKI